MKKAIIAIVLLAAIAVPGFASVTDMVVDVGIQNSSSVLEYNGNDIKFQINLQAGFGMVFDNGPGFDLMLTAESNFNKLELGAYYMHKIDFRNSDVDMLVKVGPSFTLSDPFAIGLDVMLDFLFNISDSFYVSVGTGMLMEIVEFRNGDAVSDFTFDIPLPSVGLGFKF